MKLKNKKTGEIRDVQFGNHNDPSDGVILVFGEKREPQCLYHSLAELCEEWEDYEEPKSFYAISLYPVKVIRLNTEIYKKDYSQIGNVFETEEEAEKAVEKLKAWKRLKDKGFRFAKIKKGLGCGGILYKVNEESEEVMSDLKTIFGGNQ